LVRAHPGKCFVLHPFLKILRDTKSRSEEAQLAEACGLATAIGLDIIGAEALGLNKIAPATYIGGGKAETIKAIMAENQAQLLFVNTDLSPGQQRNLETAIKAKVIDRTGMILEIFGARARTAEGQLQVELAALQYQRSRLVRSWTHLERQRGGHGFLGGPGEKQLELDRRMLEARIEKIKYALEQVTRTRGLQRTNRQRQHLPIIALIGYTNAGKSTLFNRLTRAEVLVKDMVFATLDPTIRPIILPGGGGGAVLSDTVGFIADLPTQLIAAFRATLEEVASADILLHVRDIHSPESDAQAQDVTTVLQEMGMAENEWRPRCIEVWNKYDLLSTENQAHLVAMAAHNDLIQPLSAVTGHGIDELLLKINKLIIKSQNLVFYHLVLRAEAGAALAFLYQKSRIQSIASQELQVMVHCALPTHILEQFQTDFAPAIISLNPA
jgi:GTPase